MRRARGESQDVAHGALPCQGAGNAVSIIGCTSLWYNVQVEVTYSAARRSLAELLERAERGERITITRRGRPVAELGPTRERPTLDLDRLARLRREVSDDPIENGVLLAREEERY